MTIETIAKVCHQANKAYCESLGDLSQKDWDEAPDWQKQSAIKGVEFKLTNLNSSPADQHNSWLEEKRKDGWKYGPFKNPSTKEHPCFLKYEDLPKEQQAKDALFAAIVLALK